MWMCMSCTSQPIDNHTSQQCRRAGNITMPRRRSTASRLLPPQMVAYLNRFGLALHDAAFHGDVRRVALLAGSGSIDPNIRAPGGWTPLMIAVEGDHEDCTKILQNNGANASMANDQGCTPLHFCAYTGNLAILKMLLEAGADLAAVNSTTGCTALHIAAEEGHSEVLTALIEAGANLNYRTYEGDTPLYTSCESAQPGAVRVLLRAGADPLLTSTDSLGQTFIPLEIAAFKGHSDVVRELLQQLDIGACGGETRGVRALRGAAQEGHIGTMSILTDAGVVDTGEALVDAAGYCGEAAVRFLLQRRRRQHLSMDTTCGDAYANARGKNGKTAVISGILLCRSGSPRVVRMLIDAGADTALAVQLTMPDEMAPFFRGTPLDYLKVYTGQKKEDGASEATMNILEAIRRLLMRVEAVHAVSWLWHTSSDVPTKSHAAHGIARTKTAAAAAASTPLIRMLPILRRRANRRGVVLAPLFRRSSKP